MAPPKGTIVKGSGKKGGTVFPRISLATAIPLAKKLVSKTHVAPQPAEIILPGVFGSSHSPGQIKASALKQYGLLVGKADAYQASELAKKINAAPSEELSSFYAQACLAPAVFGLLYKTFHGDTVPLSKIKQQAAAASVHPDFQDNCVDLFAKSVVFSGLGTLNGETLTLVAAKPNTTESQKDEDEESTLEPPLEDVVDDVIDTDEVSDAAGKNVVKKKPPRAVVNVNVTLDSTLDTDKLERQLALLRKYGAL